MVVFPQSRLRRLRRTETIRILAQETRVEARDLVYPLFVEEGRGIKKEIPSMPGICRFSPDQLSAEVYQAGTLRQEGV